MSGKPYPKPEYVIQSASAILQPRRNRDKVVDVPRELPCNVIIVHGVNDVGTGYAEVEAGVCAGLQDRLYRRFKSATYRMPMTSDRKKTWDDPDAVFFIRNADHGTNSPIIPFYWGFSAAGTSVTTRNGQKIDRHGNRLDKDLSKGGGPFSNATSSLPDMWNRGVSAPADPVGDPLRPIKTCPGRMYMVLAARRLAALVSMIRHYEPNDTVNIVAHSQGCLVSLLAQAFLMEMKERTADTLILTHPPYSLEEEMGMIMRGLTLFKGDKDPAMEEFYDLIAGPQSTHARLQTLANIVTGIAQSRKDAPVFTTIGESNCGGMVHGYWKPDADRDNRGKVYLYFSPEDMTVALDNMRGIGWQGVPDAIKDTRHTPPSLSGVASESSWDTTRALMEVTRPALEELGPTFRQRVFTSKLRAVTGQGKATPVLVGQKPHDFALRLQGEDDHAHVSADGRSLRMSLPVTDYSTPRSTMPRRGFRTINGEQLKTPFQADLTGTQVNAGNLPSSSRMANMADGTSGPCEEVDPIDAAIAVTSKNGLNVWFEQLPASYTGSMTSKPTGLLSEAERESLEILYNHNNVPDATNPDDRYRILNARRRNDQSITAQVQEGPNIARLRWQQEYSPKSFHSVIFGSRKNHQYVTAYDLSIGSGKAASDPHFYAYLCAVADWRLKIPIRRDKPRPGILVYRKFSQQFGEFYDCEPEWRKRLIYGSAWYYSTGELPSDLPVLSGGLWEIVISETVSGVRVSANAKGKR